MRHVLVLLAACALLAACGGDDIEGGELVLSTGGDEVLRFSAAG